MVIRKKTIIIYGKEVRVPTFDTKIIPGKEIESYTLDKLSEEEEIEKKLQGAIEEIRIAKTKYKNVVKNISYFYEIGKILQFVDKKDYFRKQRGKIWQRMAGDLAPDLFESTREPKRHAEFMYLLAKIPKQFIKKASWDQWYEIMKFKKIYQKLELLRRILQECKTVGAGPSLRERIKFFLDKTESL